MPSNIENRLGKTERDQFLPYSSHFDEFAEEVDLVEDFQGNTKLAIAKLRLSLQTTGGVHKNIFLSSLISKATIDQKVKLWEQKELNDNDEKIEAAVDAIRLCIELADPIYHEQNENALKALDRYESFIAEKELEEIYNWDVTEGEADRRIMPTGVGGEDLRKAENLAKATGNAPILAIILAHRGVRRGLDFFYDYVSKTGAVNSEVYLIRCKNTFPKLTDSETKSLNRDSEGREIVVIGPPELFRSPIEGGLPINRLRLGKNCFSKTVLGTDDHPAKVFPVPISLKNL